jgi:hypothetical protein
LKSYGEFSARKLDPQIHTIIRRYKEKKMGLRSDEANADMEAIKHNYNLVHWTIGQHEHPELADAAEVGHMQMTAAFAALSPIGMSISYAIFDLASRPEVAEEQLTQAPKTRLLYERKPAVESTFHHHQHSRCDST